MVSCSVASFEFFLCIVSIEKKYTDTENGFKLNLVKYHFYCFNKTNIVKENLINVNRNY